MANALASGAWLRRPDQAVVDIDNVRFTTSPGTDLWQRTYYGFRTDNAPALLLPVTGSITLTVRASFEYRRRYDQAGVLVYLDSDTWAKASIEREDDQVSRLGSVVTNHGYSDWATQDISSIGNMWFRISRRGPDFRFEAGVDGRTWEQLRIFHLHRLGDTTEQMGKTDDVPEGPRVGVGVYACSPEESSFDVTFDQISLKAGGWQRHI